MNLYNLKYREDIRFSVEDVEDYNIPATFDHDAACDIEYYGYRETTFNVSSVEVYDQEIKLWLPILEDEKKVFVNHKDSELILIVQNSLDDKQGEV